MRTNRLPPALLLAACCWTAASAQPVGPSPAPTPLDSFGALRMTDWRARLDAFAAELEQAPGSRGYIVAYAARNQFPGWPLRQSSQALR